MSKKSKKELAKAEAMMAKAIKMQAKARKMKDEAAQLQLALIQSGKSAGYIPSGTPSSMSNQLQIPAPLPESNAQPDASPDPTPMYSGDRPLPPSTGNGIGHHVNRNRFLYMIVGAVVLIAASYFVYAASKRGQTAVAAPTPAASERNETVQQAVPSASPQLPTSVAVLEKWEMPEELLEISSNAFLDADRVACIQDNDGIIYTYNLKTREIESRLRFGAPGDYEALCVVGSTFYALRSDGLLFEVQPSASGKPAVKQYDLPLNAASDTEPMFYDAPNNRLLVGVKEKDPGSADYKGVYSFDLATKTMALKPVMTIPAGHAPADADEAGSSKKKKARKSRPIKPSEIAIDPQSGDLYVLNGPHAEFLILDQQGNLKQTIQLDKSIFPQPEGMCFSPAGDLYISSEGGKKGRGVIAKVELK